MRAMDTFKQNPRGLLQIIFLCIYPQKNLVLLSTFLLGRNSCKLFHLSPTNYGIQSPPQPPLPPPLPVSFAIWAAPVFAKFCCQLSKPRQPFVFRMQQQQQQQRREFDARGKKRWEKTLLENHCNNFICNAIFSL